MLKVSLKHMCNHKTSKSYASFFLFFFSIVPPLLVSFVENEKWFVISDRLQENDVIQHHCTGVKGTNILQPFSGTYCLLLIALLINLCLGFTLSEDARACHLAQGNEINLSLTMQM